MKDNKHTNKYIMYQMVTSGIKKQGEEHLFIDDDPAGETVKPLSPDLPNQIQRIDGEKCGLQNIGTHLPSCFFLFNLLSSSNISFLQKIKYLKCTEIIENFVTNTHVPTTHVKKMKFQICKKPKPKRNKYNQSSLYQSGKTRLCSNNKQSPNRRSFK